MSISAGIHDNIGEEAHDVPMTNTEDPTACWFCRQDVTTLDGSALIRVPLSNGLAHVACYDRNQAPDPFDLVPDVGQVYR